jgi:catechol 2,3-dioxygenase-like lactoylglutathione lyase family enzyme
MNLKLEAIVVPVSDVDRAKKFYREALGFRVDVDHRAAVYEKALASGTAAKRVIASCS